MISRAWGYILGKFGRAMWHAFWRLCPFRPYVIFPTLKVRENHIWSEMNGLRLYLRPFVWFSLPYFRSKYVTFLPNYGSEQVRLSTFTYFTFCRKLSVVNISFWCFSSQTRYPDCTIELNEIQSHRQIFRQFQIFKKTVSPLPHLFIIIKATSCLESYISLKSLVRTPLLKDSYFV